MSGPLRYEALVVCFALIQNGKPAVASKLINPVLYAKEGVQIRHSLFVEESVINISIHKRNDPSLFLTHTTGAACSDIHPSIHKQLLDVFFNFLVQQFWN